MSVSVVSAAKVLKRLFPERRVTDHVADAYGVFSTDLTIAYLSEIEGWTYERHSRLSSMLRAAWRMAEKRGERFDARAWWLRHAEGP